MEIQVGDKKLRKVIEDEATAKKQYGVPMSKLISRRIASLSAEESLAVFWPPKSGPERCHELKGESVGKFTVDLVQPDRLVFEPVGETPQKDRSNEQERWRKITKINLLSIEDTHE